MNMPNSVTILHNTSRLNESQAFSKSINNWCTVPLYSHLFASTLTNAKYLISSWSLTSKSTLMIPITKDINALHRQIISEINQVVYMQSNIQRDGFEKTRYSRSVKRHISISVFISNPVIYLTLHNVKFRRPLWNPMISLLHPSVRYITFDRLGPVHHRAARIDSLAVQRAEPQFWCSPKSAPDFRAWLPHIDT
jgi:hypothetical protein